MNIRSGNVLASVSVLFACAACGGGISLGHNDADVKGSGGANGGSSGSGSTSNGSAGSAPSNGGSATSGNGGSATTSASCGSGLAWTAFLQQSLTIQPGSEVYSCARKTLTDDLDLTALRLQAAPGTLSSRLAYGPPGGPDGTADCPKDVGGQTVFDSDLENGEYEAADGEAVQVAAGQQLVFQVHGVNTASAPETGVWNLQVVEAPASSSLSAASLPITLSPACDGFSALVDATFVVQPGAEQFICVRRTLGSALDVETYRITIPDGVHDYQLSYGPPDGSDGIGGDCSAATQAQPNVIVPTSMEGSTEFDPPAGPSSHIDAGQQVLLQVHALDAQANPISGDALVETR